MTFVQKNVHKIRKWRLRATPLQMYQSCSCGEMPAKRPFIYYVSTFLGKEIQIILRLFLVIARYCQACASQF
jgi:hypothetical protein